MVFKTGKPQKPLVYSLLKIVSARSQVVSGVKYYIEVKFRDSLCPKQKRRSLSSASCLHPEQCEVTVWEQPWLNHTELVSYECKQKSAQLGVRQRISNKDEHALKALDFAVLKMNLEAVNERAYFKPQILNTYRSDFNTNFFSFESGFFGSWVFFVLNIFRQYYFHVSRKNLLKNSFIIDLKAILSKRF